MCTAHLFLSLWLFDFPAGRAIEGLGITDMMNHPAAADDTEVWFTYTSISLVPGNYFVNLSSLTAIQLYNNRISDIAEYAFVAVPTVTEIYLSYNELQVITEHMFAGLTSLEMLELYDNEIHTIELNSFSDTTALTTLDLSGL